MASLLNMSGGSLLEKGLPYDYEVEYLESIGWQYIDTLYKATITSCHVEGKISFTSFTNKVSNNFIIPFGAFRNACPVDIYVPKSNNSSVSIGIECGTTYGTRIPAGTISVNTPFTFDLEAFEGKLNGYCNGVFYENQGYNGNLNSLDTLALFCSKSSGYPYAYTSLRCFYFKCLTSDGTLVRDFIPVVKDNVGYMYDKVSGQLFGNAGTGDFILGPDK